VLHQGLTIGAAGVLLGVASVLALGSLVQPFLFGVTATDPLVLVVTAASLLLCVFGATVGPTRLATRTDPLLVLRSD
jgi:ABC-type antimicrobial peptide transport system permease subunit